MAENPIPEGELPPEHAPAEPDLEPDEAEARPVETRGLAWILVPALLGGLLGTGVGMAQAVGGLQGGLVGLSAGGVFGLLVWVLFPYKGGNPHAPLTEEAKDAAAAPDATEGNGA